MITGLNLVSPLPAQVLFKLQIDKGDQQLTDIRAEKAVQKEIDYFNEAAPKILTIDDFLADRRLVEFATVAGGMFEERFKTGLLKRVLTEPRSDEKSAANVLPDKRFLGLAETLEFDTLGTSNLRSKTFRDTFTDSYVKGIQSLRIEAQNPAVSAALFLRKEASGINSPFEILGSATLREVFTIAFDIPREIAVQPVESQAAFIGRVVDLKDLQDPEKVDKIIQRFLIKVDLDGGPGATPLTGPNAFVLDLFNPLPSGGGSAIGALFNLST